MGTQLILTVGTNALPVWVAWYHLKDRLKPPITVRFVHTQKTNEVKDRLEGACDRADFGDHVSTSAGNPQALRKNIKKNVVECLPLNDPTVLHVHYTGGTQVMGVETVAAIESGIVNLRHSLQTSYLDVHGGSGPRIRSRWDPGLIADARQGIEPNLGRIANLNGFDLLSSNAPTEVQSTAGQAYLQNPRQIYLEDSHTDTIDGTRIVRGKAYDSGDLLEYGAYAAFKKALEKICAEAARSGRKRDNYKLFHDVKAKRIEATADGEDFQLDVVAIFGLSNCGCFV